MKAVSDHSMSAGLVLLKNTFSNCLPADGDEDFETQVKLKLLPMITASQKKLQHWLVGSSPKDGDEILSFPLYITLLNLLCLIEESWPCIPLCSCCSSQVIIS
jgi:hypothetical protein